MKILWRLLSENMCLINELKLSMTSSIMSFQWVFTFFYYHLYSIYLKQNNSISQCFLYILIKLFLGCIIDIQKIGKRSDEILFHWKLTSNWMHFYGFNFNEHCWCSCTMCVKKSQRSSSSEGNWRRQIF